MDDKSNGSRYVQSSSTPEPNLNGMTNLSYRGRERRYETRKFVHLNEMQDVVDENKNVR